MPCHCGGITENADTGECAKCGHARRKAKRVSGKPKKAYRMPKQKTKMAKATPKLQHFRKIYHAMRPGFLEGKICPVSGEIATEIHHMKGRSHLSFADQWAKDNNKPLIIDERYFLAVSASGHDYIEKHPEWAKMRGYTLSRHTLIK